MLRDREKGVSFYDHVHLDDRVKLVIIPASQRVELVRVSRALRGLQLYGCFLFFLSCSYGWMRPFLQSYTRATLRP